VRVIKLKGDNTIASVARINTDEPEDEVVEGESTENLDNKENNLE
jgi:hypothetical protein